MTPEEAIKELKEEIDLYDNEIVRLDASIGTPDRKLIDALEMAIDALQARTPELPEVQSLQVHGEIKRYTYCTKCEKQVFMFRDKFCPGCGRKIDWSEIWRSR